MNNDQAKLNTSSVIAQTSNGEAAGIPTYKSQALLSGGREAVIQHAGEEYRLRLTRQGKLILTK